MEKHYILHLLWTALLLLYCSCGCLAATPRDCMHDRITRMNRQTAVVREIHRKGQGAMQAYTASAAPDSSNSDDSKNWKPIRIKAFTKDLDDPSKYCTKAGDIRIDQMGKTVHCRADGVLTVRKKRIIVEQIIPAAIKMHSERLSVVPVTGTVLVPRENIGLCSKFTIPEEHHTVGLKDADLYIYVSGLPMYGASAWAISCGILENNRTIMGAVNLSPSVVAATNKFIRTMTHEIAHILGFGEETFVKRKMFDVVKGLRGKKEVRFLSSPKVKEVAQKYYNCSETLGMELEDQGGRQTDFSHFKERNAKDELMGPASKTGYYTELTLSVFEDLGFYKVNYSMAEPMRWGRNSGCGFLNEKCLTEGVSPSPDMFCNQFSSKSAYFCTPDRLGLGYCTLYRYEKDFPKQYRYFSNERFGGPSSLMDYCPFVEPEPNSRCDNSTKLKARGSFIGPNARCVKGYDLIFAGRSIGDVCVNTMCEEGKLKVQFLGDDNWYPCGEGEKVRSDNRFWSGKIICPRYDDVCTAIPNTTIVLEPLPAQDNDNEPAPENITLVNTESQIPPPQSTPLRDPNPEVEEKPPVNDESVEPKIPERPPPYESTSSQSTETDTTVGQSMPPIHIFPNLPDSTPPPEKASTPVVTTSTDTRQDGDTRKNLTTNGNGGTAHAPNNKAGLTLNIGIGDGSVTAAGCAHVVFLVLASAVTVAVSL